MKKLIILTAIVLAPLTSIAQSFFTKYEDLKGVTSGVINQKMFSMIASMNIESDDPEAQAFLDMAKKIQSVKILTTGDKTISSNLSADVEKHISSSNLEELMRFKDGDQNVKFFVKSGKDENHVKELLMHITGLKEVTKGADIKVNGEKRDIETVVVSIVGDIDLRQISKMTSKMNIPGGEQLEKAGKGKK
uniref:DUF4252 domain-containing protein n=1 Tax=Gelidibacter sp. TaxID=2018083 RepID=UPI004049EFB9